MDQAFFGSAAGPTSRAAVGACVSCDGGGGAAAAVDYYWAARRRRLGAAGAFGAVESCGGQGQGGVEVY